MAILIIVQKLYIKNCTTTQIVLLPEVVSQSISIMKEPDHIKKILVTSNSFTTSLLQLEVNQLTDFKNKLFLNFLQTVLSCTSSEGQGQSLPSQEYECPSV